MLNCQPYDVPVLVAARLLKPLGNPPPNGVKYFATADVLELMADRAWLVKVTNAVHHYWQRKNAAMKRGAAPGFGNCSVSSAMSRANRLCVRYYDININFSIDLPVWIGKL